MIGKERRILKLLKKRSTCVRSLLQSPLGHKLGLPCVYLIGLMEGYPRDTSD